MQNNLFKAQLKQEVMNRIDMTRDIRDQDINRIIDECILEKGSRMYISITEKEKLRIELFNSIRRLDILSELLECEHITEIMINGHDNIFVEERGSLRKINASFYDEVKLLDVIQQIVGRCNRIVNESTPIVDARLEDGSRVNVVLPPVSLSGAVMTIRKFPQSAYTMNNLIDMGALDVDVAKKLELMVKSGYNIFISGGTGSGKTTFLNALTNYIPRDERIITIEDSAELRIEEIENLVSLEVRNANVEGENEIAMRDLIKSALRMRPSRIIVGEVRDGAALDMLNAMNTGHSGSLSTGHANSARDMISRLETMVLMAVDMPLIAVKQQISSAIDIIIHLGRLRDKSRRILEIVEVLEVENGQIQLNSLYKFHEDGMCSNEIKGQLLKENTLIKVDKMKTSGLYEEYKRGEIIRRENRFGRLSDVPELMVGK